MIRVCTRCSCKYNHYGQRSSFCRDCKRAYDREYHRNRDSHAKIRKISRQKELLIEKRQFIYDYLLEHPCTVCGESDPVVLDFDHVDMTLKENNISNMTSHSLDSIREEISKCRVLCANCHRRRKPYNLIGTKTSNMSP